MKKSRLLILVLMQGAIVCATSEAQVSYKLICDTKWDAIRNEYDRIVDSLSFFSNGLVANSISKGRTVKGVWKHYYEKKVERVDDVFIMSYRRSPDGTFEQYGSFKIHDDFVEFLSSSGVPISRLERTGGGRIVLTPKVSTGKEWAISFSEDRWTLSAHKILVTYVYDFDRLSGILFSDESNVAKVTTSRDKTVIRLRNDGGEFTTSIVGSVKVLSTLVGALNVLIVGDDEYALLPSLFRGME